MNEGPVDDDYHYNFQRAESWFLLLLQSDFKPKKMSSFTMALINIKTDCVNCDIKNVMIIILLL